MGGVIQTRAQEIVNDAHQKLMTLDAREFMDEMAEAIEHLEDALRVLGVDLDSEDD